MLQEQEASRSGELQNIVSLFPKVMYRGSRSEIKSPLNLNNFLPANPSSYFRYMGSLTTPDCAEGVTWSVLTLPLPVGKEQVMFLHYFFVLTLLLYRIQSQYFTKFENDGDNLTFVTIWLYIKLIVYTLLSILKIKVEIIKGGIISRNRYVTTNHNSYQKIFKKIEDFDNFRT